MDKISHSNHEFEVAITGGAPGGSSLASESLHTRSDQLKDVAVTLEEVIAAENELDAEARALLGDQDDGVCTYPEGYKERQPVYACLDCTHESELAAICYGCSVHCHEGHNVCELYTKRNFCCDCGNSKFKSRCHLYENKISLNSRNVYNHNFLGLYCTCDQPHPSPDYPDSVMLQCVVCEDWYHFEHLLDSTRDVDIDAVEEVICQNCVSRLDFLIYYADEVYVENTASKVSCKKEWLQQTITNPPPSSQTLFFNAYEWRCRLCECESCLDLYSVCGVTYLIDMGDSLQTYVGTVSEKDASPLPDSKVVIDAIIDRLGRDGAVTMLKGYEEMKEVVKKRLKRFAEHGMEVKADDIKQIFDELAVKRRRTGANSSDEDETDLMDSNSC